MPTPPIPLNSRTFSRNIKPYNYPDGTRVGHDWTAAGGIYDNTDQRNPIYWGSPRPINGHADFGLDPGETPANAVRRLKIEGYMGLYSARPSEELRRQDIVPDDDEPGYPEQESGLAAIARAAAAMRERRDRTVHVSTDGFSGGRRLTRTEMRQRAREDSRESLMNGDPGKPAPQLIGLGMGVEDTEREQRLESVDDEWGTGNVLRDGTVIQPHELPAPVADFGDDLLDSDDAVPVEEDEDAPVGGGGRAVLEPHEESTPPVLPPRPVALPKLGGGGRRRAEAPPPPAPAADAKKRGRPRKQDQAAAAPTA